MQYRLDSIYSSTVLLGSNADRSEAAPGDPTLVTLFWSAATETTATLSLVDEVEKIAANWPLTLPVYGEGAWRSQHLLRLPVGLANGNHQWQLTFPNGQTTRWGELTITAPNRLLTMPDVETAVNITLSEQATLIGFSLDDPPGQAGEMLNLELIWRAETELSESYRVFVHVLGEDGRIVAQADGLAGQLDTPHHRLAPWRIHHRPTRHHPTRHAAAR